MGAGAVSAAEFEVAELYVPAVGLKQSAQWIDEEKFQAELTLEVSGLKELYKSQQENTASENGQLQMEIVHGMEKGEKQKQQKIRQMKWIPKIQSVNQRVR